MYMKVCLLALLLAGGGSVTAQEKHTLSSFVEYGATVHTGDNTPLWQVSNRQGLASIDNSTYVRGALFYHDRWGKWTVEGERRSTAWAISRTEGGYPFSWEKDRM